MKVNRRKIIPLVEVTKADLAQTCMGVIFIRSVSDTIFAMLFPSETACGPPGTTV
jgi:hypothetical protein